MFFSGGLAIGVPGEIRAYQKAYEVFGGGVSWSELFQPTIKLCEEGFVVSESQASAIRQTSRVILNNPALRLLRNIIFLYKKNDNY